MILMKKLTAIRNGDYNSISIFERRHYMRMRHLPGALPPRQQIRLGHP